MTNNHLYWTVTTILQEQSGTRRAEIVKYMIKIASVSSIIVHPYYHILCVIAVNDFYLYWSSPDFLRIPIQCLPY